MNVVLILFSPFLTGLFKRFNKISGIDLVKNNTIETS